MGQIIINKKNEFEFEHMYMCKSDEKSEYQARSKVKIYGTGMQQEYNEMRINVFTYIVHITGLVCT